MSENEKNSLQLRDSINAFLKEYNKTKGYSMIYSNTVLITCCMLTASIILQKKS